MKTQIQVPLALIGAAALIAAAAIVGVFILARRAPPLESVDPASQRASSDENLHLAIEQGALASGGASSKTPLRLGAVGSVESGGEPSVRSSVLEEIARRAGRGVDELRYESLISLEREEFLSLLHHTNAVAREHELEIINSLPADTIISFSRDEALQMYRDNPNAYFARIPSTHRANAGSKRARYVDLTDVAADFLTECREFAVATSSYPSFEAAQIDAHQQIVERAGPSGRPSAVPVADWVAEDFGQRLAGYDSTGNLVAEVKAVWPGVPLY